MEEQLNEEIQMLTEEVNRAEKGRKQLLKTHKSEAKNFGSIKVDPDSYNWLTLPQNTHSSLQARLKKEIMLHF